MVWKIINVIFKKYMYRILKLIFFLFLICSSNYCQPSKECLDDSCNFSQFKNFIFTNLDNDPIILDYREIVVKDLFNSDFLFSNMIEVKSFNTPIVIESNSSYNLINNTQVELYSFLYYYYEYRIYNSNKNILYTLGYLPTSDIGEKNYNSEYLQSIEVINSNGSTSKIWKITKLSDKNYQASSTFSKNEIIWASIPRNYRLFYTPKNSSFLNWNTNSIKVITYELDENLNNITKRNVSTILENQIETIYSSNANYYGPIFYRIYNTESAEILYEGNLRGFPNFLDYPSVNPLVVNYNQNYTEAPSITWTWKTNTDVDLLNKSLKSAYPYEYYGTFAP